ncbi:MAG: MoxR-like ATPase [Bacteriovoracaceae bacterium]|jgi:MoxR-like ATPase
MFMSVHKIKTIEEKLSEIVLGKEQEVRLALACLLSRGHLLIEDVPGVGKTTLVQVLSRLLGFKMARIQCTNDLLPADIIGTNIFIKEKAEFEFRSGPLVNDFVLADELNRATPKTQSALLQAMEEGSVSHDQGTLQLPIPFVLVATQNPFDQIGTHLLPESQIDRFRMSLYLDLPGREVEKRILLLPERDRRFEDVEPVLSIKEFSDIQKMVDKVLVSDAIADYILDLLEYARRDAENGFLSSRAGRDVLFVSKALAWMNERDHILPEDIQMAAPFVWGHRLAGHKGIKHGSNLVKTYLSHVSVN